MTGLRILLTGSREFHDRVAIRDALGAMVAKFSRGDGAWSCSDITLVHGGARGADTIAEAVATAWGWTIERHPCTNEDWAAQGRSAGPRRNARMVALGADVCVAFPLGEARGTRNCMGLAEAAGIPVINYGEELAA